MGFRKRKEREPDADQIAAEIARKQKTLNDWVPKTALGRKVKVGEITSIEEIFEKGWKILEPEVVDSLLRLEEETIEVAKTTRVVTSGRKFSFRATVMVGNRNGYIGIATGKATEKFPAIEKASKKARLNIKKIVLGSGSWEEQPTSDKHSIPFKVIGKCGGVKVTLLPAPKGTGLAVGKNIKKVLEFAGVRNVWSKARGSSDTRLNFVLAAIDALEKTAQMRVSKDVERKIFK
ncbi:MAG: 30S ribosomal protein S5 [Candidatus Diapherotrites archaeon]|nr:30S ribosomal protein S5 [Candidatus Diapherotrites archaeon]